jgi:hypothetical protein
MTTKEEILAEIKEIRDLKHRVFVIQQGLTLLEKQRQIEQEETK